MQEIIYVTVKDMQRSLICTHSNKDEGREKDEKNMKNRNFGSSRVEKGN